MNLNKKQFLYNFFVGGFEKFSFYILILISLTLICSSIVIFFTFPDELYKDRISLILFLVGLVTLLLTNAIKLKYQPAMLLNFSFIFLFLMSIEMLFQIKQLNQIPSENLKKAAENEGLYFDERNTLDVVRDLREADIDAYPVFNSSFWSKFNESTLPNYHIYPLGGISSVTTVYCNENGNYTIYLSGLNGFRNPIEMKIDGEEVNNNQNSVVVIGDSFAHGACVGTGESFPAELRKKNLRVWNFASGGLGPMSEFAILKEYGTKVRPKTVLWVYYHGNDLASLYQSSLNPILKRYLEEPSFSQDLVNKQAEIDFFWRNYYRSYENEPDQNKSSRQNSFQSVLTNTFKLSILRDRYSLVTGYSKLKKEFALQQFSKILQQAKSLSSQWGGKFLFIYIPAIETLFQKYPKDSDVYGFNKQEVIEILKNNQIPFIDVENYLYAHPDYKSLFPFSMPAHFNSLGYDFLADVVYNHPTFQQFAIKNN